MSAGAEGDRLAASEDSPAAAFDGAVARAVEALQPLDFQFTRNPFRDLSKRVILACAGGRVGSHLLMEHLLCYGIDIDEYFDKDKIQRRLRLKKFDSLQAYCNFILISKAVNGVFGVKGSAGIVAPLALAGEFPRFAREWRFLYLYRRDPVRQAISAVKANITGSWHSMEPAARVLGDADYDAVQIRQKIKGSLGQRERWARIFSFLEAEPYVMTYEDLMADPEGTARRVAAHAGLDGKPLPAKTAAHERQSDEISERWNARFREENATFCRKIDRRAAAPPLAPA